jgi:hypothetical protein
VQNLPVAAFAEAGKIDAGMHRNQFHWIIDRRERKCFYFVRNTEDALNGRMIVFESGKRAPADFKINPAADYN